MSDSGHRWQPLSPFRRNVVELLRRTQKVPLVTAERKMRLADVIDARQAIDLHPSWTAIFTKAFSIVAALRPDLRRSYFSFPWAHLYEHGVNVAMVMVERNVNGEDMPLNYRIRRPELRSVAAISEELRRAKTAPIDEVPIYRRMKMIGLMPGFLRRFLWSFGYHWSGRKRAHYYGTFALSSPAASGAGLTTILSPVTLTLHYGMFDDAGNIDMRLTFDHRAIDGAPVARALAEMEAALHGEILTELRQQSRLERAA